MNHAHAAQSEAAPDGQPSRLSSQPSQVEDCTMIIFGASGDLARRKLLPALYQLFAATKLPQRFSLVSFSRSINSDEFARELFFGSVSQHFGHAFEPSAWYPFASRIHAVEGQYDNPESYAELRRRIEQIESDIGAPPKRIFYLATPPSLYETILSRLHESGLASRDTTGDGAGSSRVVIEKPFGHDLATARELNNTCARLLDEGQIYRMDHFLGKETVQNLLIFRFGNTIFEPIWNREHVRFVEITAAESLGIEGRWGYYDQTGVVRDMVQSHLIQILAFCAMEQPARFTPEEIRDEKAKVLKSIHPLAAATLADKVVLGQYEGYRGEPEIAPDSQTPTYAALKVEIANWRWQGVPFYLRTGKRLKNKITEIILHLQPVPLCLFGFPEECHHVQPNALIIRLQPDEGITLRMACKVPGDHLAVSPVSMRFSYREAFGPVVSEGHEALLLDVMRGDATSFARRDEVELAWSFLETILAAQQNQTLELHPYAAGGPGPIAADRLPAETGSAWSGL